MTVSLQEVIGKPVEVIFQSLFVKTDLGQLQEIVLKIIQISADRLSVKTIPGITNRVVEIATRSNLELGEYFHYMLVHLDQTVRKPLPFSNSST